ncbi:hypothetical protein BG36_14405 [Aquamicrobium defluvii]|uniref:Uncharacterized protein n=1 Tax=Aquamicrobium defluvii TaxID=69279 RepID=A0A011UUV2_9HYPH|nr:hypothetical protein BG36_14405 [Aquamicrobium defluvii]EZQ16787.1 hypothetical protein CF98_39915 [Halopseudomonas bauzanensis]
MEYPTERRQNFIKNSFYSFFNFYYVACGFRYISFYAYLMAQKLCNLETTMRDMAYILLILYFNI